MQTDSQLVSGSNSFEQQLRDLLRSRLGDFRTRKVAKHVTVYSQGDQDATVYCIERGQIKVEMLAPHGKACIVAVYTGGDVFGELCLSGSLERTEKAVAMEESDLKIIPPAEFFMLLSRGSLLEEFVRYMAERAEHQQQVIASLTTRDSEQCLGRALLELAQRLGRTDQGGIRIEPRISHEELAKMVGTTRPRISQFMQRFRELGLVEKSADRFLIVKEKKLDDYLARAF